MSVTTQNFTYNLPNYNFADMIGFGAFGGGFNQYGCNFNPSYVNMGLSIFGMVTQAAVSYIDGRGGKNNDTPSISAEDLRKQAETNVNNDHPEYETNIKNYTNALSTATTQCGIWSESLSKLTNLYAQKTNYEKERQGETDKEKADREALLQNIKGQIETENIKINEAKQKLFPICPSDINLATCEDPNEVITAINTLLESAKKEKEDAVKAELKTLEAEHDKVTSSTTTPQTKAEKKAQKLLDKQKEEEAKAKQKEADRIEKEKTEQMIEEKKKRNKFQTAFLNAVVKGIGDVEQAKQDLIDNNAYTTQMKNLYDSYTKRNKK